MMKKSTFLGAVCMLFFLLFSEGLAAQAAGDFRSGQNGNWNSASTWQVYNGTAWTAATQYPGQTGGNYTITISQLSTVTVPVNTDLNIFAGDIYVKGSLVLDAILTVNQFGAGPAPNFYIQNGVVLFDKAMKLILTCGSNLYLNITDPDTQGLQPKGGTKDCNNLTEVIICDVKYSACTGQGNTSAGTFDDINSTAVKIKANLSTNPSPAVTCKNSPVIFTGSYILLSGTAAPNAVNYTLALFSKPAASVYTFGTVGGNTPPTNISSGVFDIPGDYVFRLRIEVTIGQVTANNFIDVTVTVRPDTLITLTSGSATASQSFCLGAALASITYSVLNATGATATGLPTGVTGIYNAGVFTISGTPTAAGTYNYSVTAIGGCGPANATGTVTVIGNAVTAASASPTICINTSLTGITHITTGATGIGTSTGLPAGVTAAWSGNTITISGTPTASGTFNYIIPLTGGCGAANATGTITVTADKTVSAASSSPTLCIGTLLTPITHATTGVTGIGAPTGLPAGVTAAWSANTITISGTPTAQGNFNYSIPLLGGCGSATAAGTITVNPGMAAGVSIAASPSSIICAGTAVTFTATPTNGGSAPSYQWKVNGSNAGTNSASFTSSTLTNSDVVTVVMTSNSPGPCLTASPAISNAVTITYQTTVYNGGWSITPASHLSAEIRGAYSSAGTNPEVCALHVTNNAPVTINSGDSFTVRNEVTVDAGSSLTVESGANLVQTADGFVNTGNITVQSDIKIGESRTQYNFLGSPVAFMAGETFKSIYPGTTGVLYYNESNNFFYNSTGVNIPGRGLAVKEPTKPQVPAGSTKVTAQYKGVPQNGVISFALVNSNPAETGVGFNLIGNPFPSNIDLVKLYNLNGGKNTAPQTVSTDISATFYFWDNEVNNGVAQAQQGSSYQGQAYAIFNVLTGNNGTGTAAGSLNGGLITGTKTPTHLVKVGQGFIAKSLKNTYSLKYSNSIRTSEAAPVDFLGKGNSTPDDRYWLKMITPANLTSNIAVVYFGAGQHSFGAEDSESRGGSDELYSSVDGKKTAINGKGSFHNSDVVLLGTKCYADGLYRISLAEREGVFANGQKVYLKDRQTGLITDLSEGDYSFAATAGETTGRFEIIYRPETVLATDGNVKEELLVYRDGSDFVVKAQSKKITQLEVYDASGRLVVKTQPNSLYAMVGSEKLRDGMYVMKIIQDHEVTVKKILK